MLFYTGPKTQGARSSDSDLKPIQAPKPIPVQHPKKPNSLGSSERKRESPNPTLGTPKRTKVLSSPQYSPHGTKGGEGERRPSSSSTQYFSSNISPIEGNDGSDNEATYYTAARFNTPFIKFINTSVNIKQRLL